MTDSEYNPRVDVSNVTVSAFNAIKKREKQATVNITGTYDDSDYKKEGVSPKFKTKVKAYTHLDKQWHSYFHSLSIDANVDDFMHTAELKCPYDSKLMEYWTPIRNDVVIWGSNRGKMKVLFIGRVRGVKQDGYELVIEFQSYGWKFKQLVTQSYANDNVIGKNGYLIFQLMFEALKIDSYVISEAAKQRLKQVGIDKDGNLTVNKKEVKKIPDLLKRLEKSDPSKYVNKDTLNNKLREKDVHNLENINYTLKYEKPIPVLKKIAKQDTSGYSAGSNVYNTSYSSAENTASSIAQSVANKAASNKKNQNCYELNVSKHCPQIKSTSMQGCMKLISAYNRGCSNNTVYQGKKCWSRITDYASQYNQAYSNQVAPCLSTLSKNAKRSDGKNLAQSVKAEADNIAWAKRNPFLNALNTAGKGVKAKNSPHFVPGLEV